MLDRIKTCFTESIQTQIAAAEILPESIFRAAVAIVQSLLNGNKILCCGNGLSAASAQRFSSMLIHHAETERPSLPALSLTADTVTLTAIINDNLQDEIYAKQVRAFGQAGDIFLVIAERNTNQALIKAVEAAVTRDMTIIALTGDDDGMLAGLLGPQDVEIRVPSQSSTRIQEVHTVALNCLCDFVDYQLFKSQDHE